MTSKSKQNLFYSKDYSIHNAIVEQSGEGLSLVDLEGHYVGVNQAFCEMTGYSEAELLSKKISQLIPPDTRLELFPAVLKGLSGERQIEMVRKDGEHFQTNVKISPLHHEEQTYYLGFVRDITLENQAEGNFTVNEEKYRILFDSAPDPIVIHNGNTILDVNQATLKALSLTHKAELIGGDPLD